MAVRREDEVLLEHLLLLKVQIPPRPHRARPPVPGHYSTFAGSGINIWQIWVFSNMECHLQPGFCCCCKKGGRKWKVLQHNPTSPQQPAIYKSNLKTIQIHQSRQPWRIFKDPHVVPFKKLPLGAALDTQGHNPIRPKPHNTNYCANNGTAPEQIEICLQKWN